MATTSKSTDTMKAAPNTADDHGAGHGDDHHVAHPSDATYVKVAIILAVITGVEVGLYYWPVPGVNLNNGALGVLALAKFAIVVLYFMHLKFDSRTLRRLFVTGIVLAAFCYVAVLRSMGIWG